VVIIFGFLNECCKFFMNEFQISKVSTNDAVLLQLIGKQTFYEAFKDENSEEDMNQYLNESFSSQKIAEELKNVNSEFYFAKSNDQVLGYLKINFGKSQTELSKNNSLEIERIYLLKQFYGKNVGQKLLDKALEIALKNQHDFVWLGVWENNLRAIQFYKKNGFVAFDKHIFQLGNDKQTDIMMKLMLKQPNLR
jgi:ribosomal protein S18 acetylase RimI-like enzyme